MVNKTDDLKKSLIEIRKDWIKESNSFSNKIFFTLVTLIAGVLLLYFKKSVDEGIQISTSFVAIILLAIIVLMLKVIFTSSDVKREYNKLMDLIINNVAPEKYKIEKTKFKYKLVDSLTVGFLAVIVSILLFDNTLASLLIGGALFIVLLIAPRYY